MRLGARPSPPPSAPIPFSSAGRRARSRAAQRSRGTTGTGDRGTVSARGSGREPPEAALPAAKTARSSSARRAGAGGLPRAPSECGEEAAAATTLQSGRERSGGAA
ncbi:unnamed protein product [Coccothraustes coccothraustes]